MPTEQESEEHKIKEKRKLVSDMTYRSDQLSKSTLLKTKMSFFCTSKIKRMTH